MNGFLVGIGLGLVILGTLAIGFISIAVGLIIIDKLEEEDSWKKSKRKIQS